MDADAIVVGHGLAGLVAAAELADAGRKVLLVDQESEANLGGQAHWSFGGLFFVDSPETPIFRWGATYSGHATASAVAGKSLLTPLDHTLIMIDHQSQMAFATKSIDAVALRNNAALVSRAAAGFGVLRAASSAAI